MMELTRELLDALGAPFHDEEIGWLPRGGGSSGKALALPYIDARAVMTRLDRVVGPAAWSFTFEPLDAAGKMVRGVLTVCSVTKCDAGEANDEDEPLKSAVSDALKRAAVHFGIGRYLYHLPRIWVPFDAQKKQFSERPQLSRAAVDRALDLCGIAPDVSRPPAREQPLREAGQAPDSPGDRVAASGLPVHAGEAPCSGCRAPSGKPHTRACPVAAGK